MTLALGMTSPSSIWFVADRRLSRKGRKPNDNARKIMTLETTDGNAIIGYAGLGATALDTEPADWMCAVLRGRNLPLEKSILTLAAAVKREFPKHILKMPPALADHWFLVTALLDGKPAVYTIDFELSPDRKRFRVNINKHVRTPRGAPRFVLGGSGGPLLLKEPTWRREVLRLIRAHDQNRISPRLVADYLAALNYRMHLKDGSIGPDCIVAWHRRGGGGHEYYSGAARAGLRGLPAIGGIRCWGSHRRSIARRRKVLRRRLQRHCERRNSASAINANPKSSA